MKKRSIGFIIILVPLLFVFCTEEWDNHYKTEKETVDTQIWDVVNDNPDYAAFKEHMERLRLDSIIKADHQTKTLFIPTNEAFEEFLKGDTSGFVETMKYHITAGYFMVRNIEAKYRLRTYSDKFALIENINNEFYMDGIPIRNSSPLHLDGKYYELDSVVRPKPSLYQYLKFNSTAIQRYIDTQDSLILDKQNSEPVGFDTLGRTVYDTVNIVYNSFEDKYFPISKEFRNLSATLVVPDNEDYQNALNDMADNLKGDYEDYNDIPVEWQNEVLAPIILLKGVFGGMLDPGDFGPSKMANIRGDSIIRDYEIDPASKTICSNGLAYNYTSFEIGDSLYVENILEAEEMVDSIGLGRWVWSPERVEVENPKFQPMEQKVNTASNDSTVSVRFTSNFEGTYSITFRIKHVFPNNYRLVWRTNYRNTGIYSIYVNDELMPLGMTDKEEYDTYGLLEGFWSVLGFKLYPDKRGFCDVDGEVNIEEYGDVKVKIEYKGSGEGSTNGLNFDYIALIPN